MACCIGYATPWRAFRRARAGDGATLIEAVLPRMRGHAEGDGSYEVIPEPSRKDFLAQQRDQV